MMHITKEEKEKKEQLSLLLEMGLSIRECRDLRYLLIQCRSALDAASDNGKILKFLFQQIHTRMGELIKELK